MNEQERRAVMKILAEVIGQDLFDDGCSTLAYNGGTYQGTSNMTDEELLEELESRDMTIEQCVKEYDKYVNSAVKIDIDLIPEPLRNLVDKE